MTDQDRLPDPVGVAAILPAGWGLVFRHYNAAARTELAAQTAAICRARNITLLVAGDWRLASLVHADGVHIPEHVSTHDPLAPLLQWCRQGKLLTVSTHTARSIRRAALFNADAVLLSPVASTLSHPSAPALGALRFSALARSARSPVIALGGVSLTQKERLTALGAAGIAGIGLLEEAA